MKYCFCSFYIACGSNITDYSSYFTVHVALICSMILLLWTWLKFCAILLLYCMLLAHCNIVKMMFLAFILLLLLLLVAGTLQKRSFIILYCICAHSAKSCFCYLCITHWQQIVESHFHYFYILCGSYPVDPFSCYFYIAFGLHVAEEYSCISCISSIHSSYSQRRRRVSSIGIK